MAFLEEICHSMKIFHVQSIFCFADLPTDVLWSVQKEQNSLRSLSCVTWRQILYYFSVSWRNSKPQRHLCHNFAHAATKLFIGLDRMSSENRVKKFLLLLERNASKWPKFYSSKLSWPFLKFLFVALFSAYKTKQQPGVRAKLQAITLLVHTCAWNQTILILKKNVNEVSLSLSFLSICKTWARGQVHKNSWSQKEFNSQLSVFVIKTFKTWQEVARCLKKCRFSSLFVSMNLMAHCLKLCLGWGKKPLNSNFLLFRSSSEFPGQPNS